ncbi:MAG: hypothetical protein M1812_005098 [Candelaria pacifica]|nr:MAG: hypothetical protein M1812_005098 [Candelaria pacifica]
MSESNPEITFGVEMKFLFALEREKLLERLESVNASQLSPSTPDIPTNEDLSKTLWEYVTHILNRYRLGEYCPGEPRLSLDAQFVRQPQDVDFRVWNVTTDDSLLTDEDEAKLYLSPAEEWEVRGVELVSPIFKLSEIDFVTLLYERIGRVLLDHESVFWPHEDRKGPHKAFVNKTCGLHVHLAFENQEIPLETLQNLMIIWSIFEDEIEKFQPLDCRAEYGTLPALLSRFPGEAGGKLSRKAVLMCNDPDQLMSYFRPQGAIPEHSKIRLTAFNKPQQGPNVRTIEFREHAGTLDPAAITSWVLFTSGVLRLAQALTDANLILDVAGDVGITDLFELIQFPPEEQEHFAKQIVQNARAAGEESAYWSQGSLKYDMDKVTRDGYPSWAFNF